jgi:hypothetical protein
LLLINNYSKHIYWIFIKSLRFTEICLRAVAKSRALTAPATGLTPAVWSSWLHASQCCLCSQLAGDAQWDVWRRAGQLAAPLGTFTLLAQSGSGAASCKSSGWTANARYSTVSNLPLVPGSLVVLANVDTPSNSRESLFLSNSREFSYAVDEQ